MNELTPDEIRDLLKMQPHPEGGSYVESFRDEGNHQGRAYSTAIYFLLEAGETSHWHRVRDAAEGWHFYAGAPLALTMSANGHDAQSYRLGTNLAMGERPQIIVPANWWQTATSLGRWTLVGCTVAPGFEFSSFELAAPDWKPTPRKPKGV
ncbi:cupin domain-containing protein [Ahrensia marina]|uniref:Cupin n=1 Tax=Ahrensia marina TaxID=1514904 RepID=A0A0N0E779_9HYPH|nr:cupin domain-containing protein [Ahrensia marina]KPB00868.1 cupin [Ahrensia marina]